MTQLRSPSADPGVRGDPDLPLVARVVALARRLPLITGTALVMHALGVPTRSLWDPLASRPEG
jgi:hypothetical protein